MRKLLLLLFAGLEGAVLGAAPAPQVPTSGNTVLVLYNRNMYESKSVADYYIQRRRIPKDHVLALDLPATETISRAVYRTQLEQPLLEALERNRWFVFQRANPTADPKEPSPAEYRLVSSSIRYLVLCYGLPLRIAADTNLVEKGESEARPELRGNNAAVDSELALLPHAKTGYHLFGPMPNPIYSCTNAFDIQSTNGVMVVGRLDGPDPGVAKRLVDRAIQAETDGLWGKAYFDWRGLTNGSYMLGDEWIRGAAQAAFRFGFETVVDEQPATFPAAFPMDHIALYAGWYDGNLSGPFTRPVVDFMPGAIAYHLHSFSAQTLRTVTQGWASPLLAKGATATLGCVDEPYLEGTPNVAVLFQRLLAGFTFGEAAAASQKMLSWQVTVIGDPLYRPFERSAETQFNTLWLRQSPLLEWAQLRVVNLNLVGGSSPADMVRYLEEIPETSQSPILLEKLGMLYRQGGQIPQALNCAGRALALKPTIPQKTRLLLLTVKWQYEGGLLSEAFATGERLLNEIPDYPDKIAVYRGQWEIAKKLGKKSATEDYERRLKLLGAAVDKP